MNRRKLYRLCGGILFFTLMFHASFAQAVPEDDISRAMSEGNAQILAKYFGNNIEMTINKTQLTYSATQAEMVLKKFFDKNGVRAFRLDKAGKSVNNSTYTIGTLETEKGRLQSIRLPYLR